MGDPNGHLAQVPVIIGWMVDLGYSAYTGYRVAKTVEAGATVAAGVAIVMSNQPAGPNGGTVVRDKDFRDADWAEVEQRARQYMSVPGTTTKSQAYEYAKQDVRRGYQYYGKQLASLPPGERVAKVKTDLANDAASRRWERDKRASKLNGRDIYRDGEGNYWSVDTQHGTWEKLNNKGKHQGEFDKNLNPVGRPDCSGEHDIKLR